MSGFFSICQNRSREEEISNPEPLKFKFLKAINLFNPILRSFLLPNKKESYNFSRQYLCCIKQGEKNQIPLIHLPAKNPETSIVLVYSHGSGSTLNNVFGFGVNMMVKYGIGIVLYDYNGEGEGEGEFQSYENDIKTVLSWVFKQGYSPHKTILCGFSIGSYPTLSVPGPMPRMLISPICGLIPLIEGNSERYEGQFFDNVKNAEKLKVRSLIVHCKQQFVPISHSYALVKGLGTLNEDQKIEFYEIDGYNHQNAPSFLISNEATKLMRQFLRKVLEDAKVKGKATDKHWQKYHQELKIISKFITVETGVKKDQK